MLVSSWWGGWGGDWGKSPANLPCANSHVLLKRKGLQALSEGERGKEEKGDKKKKHGWNLSEQNSGAE